MGTLLSTLKTIAKARQSGFPRGCPAPTATFPTVAVDRPIYGQVITGTVSRAMASWHGLEVFAQTPRIAFALACAGCFAISGTHAHAATKPLVDLKYDVDPALRACPDAVEFRSMVAERLKYDPYHAVSYTHLTLPTKRIV